MALTVIIATHYPEYAEFFKETLQEQGYDVDTTRSYADIEHSATETQHEVYMMDLNLGNPGSKDISPATQIYELIHNAAFVGFSNNDSVVRRAKEQGIPAANTMDLIDYNNLNQYIKR